jgi:hypothetical protein
MLTYVLFIVGTSPHQAISNQREKTKKERKKICQGRFQKGNTNTIRVVFLQKLGFFIRRREYRHRGSARSPLN